MAENGIGSLVDEIVDEKPEPSEMADQMIAAAQARQNAGIFNENPQPQIGDVSPAMEASTVFHDAGGELFDPSIHASPPSKRADGKWKRKRGRKPGSVNATDSDPSTLAVEATPVDARIQEAKNAAAIVSAQVFLIGQILGGDEWAPTIDKTMGLDERELMVAAWGDYFLEYGISKPPAWLGLTLVMLAYTAPRFFMPKTQHRWYRFRQFFSRMWAGKRKAAPEPSPESETK